jgi:serralysin
LAYTINNHFIQKLPFWQLFSPRVSYREYKNECLITEKVMASDTFFLQPLQPNTTRDPLFATATGSGVFLNHSHSTSGGLTDVQAQTLVNGGVATAIAQADAILIDDPAFSALFTETEIVGEEGSFTGSTKSEAKVQGSFLVRAGETFSFEFVTNLYLNSKEIENSNTEYAKAVSKASFLLLDTTNPDEPKVVDYFGISGKLISSDRLGTFDVRTSKKNNINWSLLDRQIDVDGNNGTDFVNGGVFGTYLKQFNRDIQLTIVELDKSAIKFAGDYLIGNLGQDVTYGTIWKDQLQGNQSANKIYGSLGNDSIEAKEGNDTLEGGQGNDRLKGDLGDDKLSGGFGNDTLNGNEGNDILVGGSGDDVMNGGQGRDTFLFRKGDSLLAGERDVINNFNPNQDQIKLAGWGNIDAKTWLSGMVSQGQIVQSEANVLLSFDTGGKLLLTDVYLQNLSASNFSLVM